MLTESPQSTKFEFAGEVKSGNHGEIQSASLLNFKGETGETANAHPLLIRKGVSRSEPLRMRRECIDSPIAAPHRASRTF